MNKFDFFNKFNDAVIIINKEKDVVYKNSTFKRVFPDFTTLEKFSHKLNFDSCALTDINAYSPVYEALHSRENFFTRISYQHSQKGFLYFDLTANKKGHYVILVFTDISAKIALEELQKEHAKLQENCEKLQEENRNYIKIKQKAQAQAIKMVLINKISNIVRESINISVILNSALKELYIMFGAFKAYFASYDEELKTFQIEQTYPKNKEKSLNSLITFDENIYSGVREKKIMVSHCIREYIEAEPFKEPVLRIILPIYHLNKLLGVLVLLSRQKREMTEEIDILENISSQLGNAIAQALTFKELENTLKELKDTQLQLINSEKMASLGQLIAGVAHEINTPVASIKSNNTVISKLIKNIEDVELAQMLEEINEIDKEGINRINKLVMGLKKFVRLDEAELQEANINKELDLTLDLMRHETKNRIVVKREYGAIPLIKCYPNMLNQVFMNILINACQSINGNGTITIKTMYANKKLIVSISDTGCGIAKSEVEKIFTAGYTTKGVGVGTGLGLAISSKIIAKHGGTLSVKSREGEGSEFIITIVG